jgi:hypothetical protein
MSQAVLLAESHPDFTLHQLFDCRVTEECLPIFNINVSLRKCHKSKLAQKFNFVHLPIVGKYIVLIDMGFLWRLLTPTSENRERNDASVYTWSDWAQKMFLMILSRQTEAKTIVCVNDPYNDSLNIKDSEHVKRSKQVLPFLGGARNVRPDRDKFPTATEFQLMFQSKENKHRIQAYLKKEFASLSSRHGVKCIYSVGNCCEDLSVTP